MTRIFTIDNGNSNPNVALFCHGLLTEVLPKDDFLNRYQAVPADAKAILADVGRPNELHELFGDTLIKLAPYRKEHIFLDMPVNYSTSLGEDRLALAYHVYMTMRSLLPALIVDAGTFATVDLVKNFGFAGGYIFPGVRRFFRIYGESARLPDLSRSFEHFADDQLPHDTAGAIINAGEIYWHGVFKELKERFCRDVKSVVVTGGDAVILKPLLEKLFTNMEIIVNLNMLHLSLYTVFENIRKK